MGRKISPRPGVRHKTGASIGVGLALALDASATWQTGVAAYTFTGPLRVRPTATEPRGPPPRRPPIYERFQMRESLLSALGALALPISAATAPLAAQQLAPVSRYSDMSVAFRFGTTGLGLEVGKLLTSHLSVRLGAYYFKYSMTKSQSDVTYNATLKLHGVSALVDLYPGHRGGFHLTAGILTNPMTISGTGQPTGGTYTINGTTYTSAQVGTLSASGKFPGVSPYVGIGFGTPARSRGPLEFLFDLGASIGKPTISLSATGAAADPALRANLQAQVAKTQHDVQKYLKVYPVLSFGLAYRF